jgi:hypothetical protein
MILTFNGISTDSLGGTVSRAEYGKTKPRTIFEKLPYRDMPLDLSRADGGKLYYEPLEVKITLIAKEDTPEELAEKISAVKAWLFSAGTNELTDSSRGGWRITDVTCLQSSVKVLNMQNTHALITVTMQANPKELNAAGTERRLI